jgi:hypothetical protein
MALFGRKKPAEPPVEFTQMLVMQMGPEIAKAMIYDYADHHGGANPDALSAILELDDQGRVAKITDPVANGAPYLPTMDVVATLNGILRPFSVAPAGDRATAFSLNFDNGAFDGRFSYPPAPGAS